MDDILLDKDGDLDSANGDLIVGKATAQNQQLLLLTNPGEWKESPTTGVGMEEFLDDDTEDELFKEIREQFKADGQTIKQLKILPSGNIGLDADYE